MADKDQTDEPLKGEILPPEDAAPLIAQETVQTEETVEGELSPMGRSSRKSPICWPRCPATAPRSSMASRSA